MTVHEILEAVQSGKLSAGDAAKLIPSTGKKAAALYCKVSTKGAVSIYGLQRMPVTLYVEQWERLLDFADGVREFLKAHDAELHHKA